MSDEQDDWDNEDAGLRLRALVDVINEEREAADEVRRLQAELNRARARLRNARRKLGERAFVERTRRNPREA